ncbi:MAG TPA: hypothetical protein VK457_05270 [Chloroflexota bacterium]|nr:hypothetical protein [Chloroflexota bacterium]
MYGISGIEKFCHVAPASVVLPIASGAGQLEVGAGGKLQGPHIPER